jgi:Tfp pilus assembly protein PilO
MTRWPSGFRFDIRQAGRLLLVAYGALILVNAVFFLLLTRPKVFEYRTMTEKTAPLVQALANRETQVDDLEEYLRRLQQTQTDLERLREEILATKNRRMIEVQLELEKLAKQFHINSDQVTYENQILEEEDLERFAMVVPLEGGYQNLRSFIQAVESSDQFLVIERVNLVRSREGGVLLELNITLATYFDAPELRQSRPQRRRGSPRT